MKAIILLLLFLASAVAFQDHETLADLEDMSHAPAMVPEILLPKSVDMVIRRSFLQTDSSSPSPSPPTYPTSGIPSVPSYPVVTGPPGFYPPGVSISPPTQGGGAGQSNATDRGIGFNLAGNNTAVSTSRFAPFVAVIVGGAAFMFVW